MVRAPCVDKNGMKKGAWSEDEDEKLRAYIQRYGHWNWRELPKFAGLSRCGKSCRLRWMNYLRPNVKRGNYTKDEEDLIIKFHQQLGNKWSAIAAKLPGRSDNEIKNHWHTHLKKRTLTNQVISEEEEEQQQQSSKQEIVSEEQHSNLVSDEQQQSSKHSSTFVVVSDEEQSSNQRIIDFSTGEIGPDLFLSSGSGNRVMDRSSPSSSMLEDGGLDLQLSLCLNYG